jgi:hypothetical protein
MRPTTYRDIDSSVLCVITRFELKSRWAVLRTFLLFRRVRREARSVEGSIASLFVVERPRTCFTISLWRDADSILRFNSEAYAHVQAANFCFRDLVRDESGVRLWSGEFRLCAMSPHNFRWTGIDFRSLIEEQSKSSG